MNAPLMQAVAEQEEVHMEDLAPQSFIRPPKHTLNMARACKGVKYMNYQEQGYGIRTLVSKKKSAADVQEPLGQPLDNFSEIDRLEENPMSLEKIYAKHDRVGTGHTSDETFVIAKVTANEDDTIRCVYADVDGESPVLIASTAFDRFTELDAGNFVRISSRGGMSSLAMVSVSRILDTSSSSSITAARLCHDYALSLQTDRDRYVTEMAIKQKEHLSSFMRPEKGEDRVYTATVGIFEFAGNKAIYGDIILQLPSRTWRNRAIDGMLEKGIAQNYEKTFRYLVGLAPEGIKVNGVSVKSECREKENKLGVVSKRWYVNDKAVAADDVTEIVATVTCYPDNQDAYDAYVAVCSKMSLRFHKMVKDGITFKVNPDHLMGLSEADIPTYMKTNDYSNAVELNVLVKKRPLEAMMIYWVGKWRKVQSAKVKRIDRVLSSTDYKYRNSNGYYVVRTDPHNCPYVTEKQASEHTWFSALPEKVKSKVNKIDAAMKVIAQVDDCLVKEDRVMYTKNHPNGKHYIDKSDAKRVWKLVQEFCEMLDGSMDERIETIEKSRELLENVIEQENIEEVTFKGKKAYIVKGQSGATYRVLHDNASVYDHATGKHICVVNGGASQVGYNYIVGVLAALAADNFTARNIHTIKGKVEV
jgi:hypothetical protein